MLSQTDWDFIKDYQTLLAGSGAILAALIAWTATFGAACVSLFSAHKVEARKVTIAELEVERRRLAFTSAIRVAASMIRAEAEFRREAQSRIERRDLRIPYPDVFDSPWEEFGLLSYQQQLELLELKILVTKFNAIIDHEGTTLNLEALSPVLEDIEKKAEYVRDSAEHRADQILALPAMRREAQRFHDDVIRSLLRPIEELQARLRKLQATI